MRIVGDGLMDAWLRSSNNAREMQCHPPAHQSCTPSQSVHSLPHEVLGWITFALYDLYLQFGSVIYIYIIKQIRKRMILIATSLVVRLYDWMYICIEDVDRINQLVGAACAYPPPS